MQRLSERLGFLAVVCACWSLSLVASASATVVTTRPATEGGISVQLRASTHGGATATIRLDHEVDRYRFRTARVKVARNGGLVARLGRYGEVRLTFRSRGPRRRLSPQDYCNTFGPRDSASGTTQGGTLTGIIRLRLAGLGTIVRHRLLARVVHEPNARCAVPSGPTVARARSLSFSTLSRRRAVSFAVAQGCRRGSVDIDVHVSDPVAQTAPARVTHQLRLRLSQAALLLPRSLRTARFNGQTPRLQGSLTYGPSRRVADNATRGTLTGRLYAIFSSIGRLRLPPTGEDKADALEFCS